MQLKNSIINFRSKCAISCGLEILGDKWTLLIVRDALFFKSTTFGEFRGSTEKIATNILTDRLEKLVRYGIMDKKKNLENKLKYDYSLTERGRQLKPVLMAIGKWGYEHIEGTQKDKVITQKYIDSKNERL